MSEASPSSNSDSPFVPRPVLGAVLIAGANALGGASFPMQKLALEGLEPGMIAALRHLIALPPILIWVLLRGARLTSLQGGEWARIAALGTVAFGLPLLLGIVGVGLSSASNGSLLILIEPVTILLLAGLVLGERIGRSQVLGVGLGLLGALCIVLETTSSAGLFRGDQFLGNAILLVHAFLWGLYTPFLRPLSQRHDALVLGTWTLAFSLVLLVPYAAVEFASWDMPAEPDVLARSLWWTLALGVFVSFGSTVLWVASLRHLQASRVAPFLFVQPLVGVFVGVAFLDERLSVAATIGGVFVALGCALALRGGGAH